MNLTDEQIDAAAHSVWTPVRVMRGAGWSTSAGWHLTDVRPLAPNDDRGLGHCWTYPESIYDDYPHSDCQFCGLSYYAAGNVTPCGGDAVAVNARRSAWIEANRYRGDGVPPGAPGPAANRWRFAHQSPVLVAA